MVTSIPRFLRFSASFQADEATARQDGGPGMEGVNELLDAESVLHRAQGEFCNVENYIILAGIPSDDLQEKCGYYGEKIVLEAQMMGLNTCWTALTFNKSNVKKMISVKEKLVLVIAIGYGANQGKAHKSRSMESVMATKGEMPDWFRRGAEAALLAPTAMNQQKFKMGIKGGSPVIRAVGKGPYTKIDLGIVKYHFEIASGHKVK